MGNRSEKPRLGALFQAHTWVSLLHTCDHPLELAGLFPDYQQA